MRAAASFLAIGRAVLIALAVSVPAHAKAPAPLPWSRADLPGSHYASAVVVARLDGDSLRDIALTDYGANHVSIFLNLGHRGFVRIADVEVGFAPQDLAIAVGRGN